MVNEREIIDLIGNVDVSMLMDKIIENDMRCRRRFSRLKKRKSNLIRQCSLKGRKVIAGKKFLFLFHGVLLVIIVLLVSLNRNKNHQY